MKTTLVAVGCGGVLYHSVTGMLSAVQPNAVILYDDDVVEEGNATRQWLRTGFPKVDVAAAMLQALHPNCKVHMHKTRVEEANAQQFIAAVDGEADGFGKDDKIIVLALPDNQVARMLLWNQTVKMSKAHKSVEYWYVTAGNSIVDGWATHTKLVGGKVTAPWLRWHNDVKAKIEEELRVGVRAACAAIPQSRSANTITAALVGMALEDAAIGLPILHRFWEKKQDGRFVMWQLEGQEAAHAKRATKATA